MKVDLNNVEEVKWEFCILAIDHSLNRHPCPRRAYVKHLTELKKILKQFLKEQE